MHFHFFHEAYRMRAMSKYFQAELNVSERY